MDDDDLSEIGRRFRQTDKMLEALTRAAREAVWKAKCYGQSITVLRDGKMVEIPASEIDIENPYTSAPQPPAPPAAQPMFDASAKAP
jgi:hypothetical protein